VVTSRRVPVNFIMISQKSIAYPFLFPSSFDQKIFPSMLEWSCIEQREMFPAVLVPITPDRRRVGGLTGFLFYRPSLLHFLLLLFL